MNLLYIGLFPAWEQIVVDKLATHHLFGLYAIVKSFHNVKKVARVFLIVSGDIL